MGALERRKVFTKLIYVNYRCNRFVLDTRAGSFFHLDFFTQFQPPTLKDALLGLDGATSNNRILLFGQNNIDIDSKSWADLAKQELTHPFNIFQLFSIIIWCTENYYLYAGVIFLMTVVSSILTINETKRNNDKIRSMAKFSCPVVTKRDGQWKEISSSQLVPGDLYILDTQISLIPCDTILINGDAILDESLLTGESIPITKYGISEDQFSKAIEDGESLNSKNTIFAGTRLLRARPSSSLPCLGLVLRTGFLTVKGNLIQSIMFPRPNNFRFYRDSMIFIGFMGILAAIGFTISVFKLIILGVSLYYIVTRALDLITVVLPPALPATMSVGTVFALNRLQKYDIFCICPPKINVASKISTICFDKTGTLTEDGLEIYAIIPSIPQPARFCGHMTSIRELECFTSQEHHLLRLMASCHSLRKINGQLMGDPLDLQMFTFTCWELEEHPSLDQNSAPIVVRPPNYSDYDTRGLVVENWVCTFLQSCF